VHSAFKVPFNANEKTPINIDQATGEHYRRIELIIIDEMGMLHCDVLEYIDALLRHVMGSPTQEYTQSFGGKTIILSKRFIQN
jgi:hypothetical protein